jgi:hypothetical protein
MQRVVRSTLAGILAAAALVGCGDKVTVPPPTTTPPDATVHSVTVSPAAVTVAVGQKVTLAASVDAGAGVTVRTVTWTSSNTAVATVDATGVVTGVTVGTATVIAASAADPNVKGASAITVTGGASPPTVTISAILQNPTGQPANLNNAFGQLDIVLNVDSNGQQLKSVSATIACPGNTSLTQTQTISAASSTAAEAAAAPITLSFNTALFNATSGAPSLRNGQCSLTASATTTTTQSANVNLGLTLNNADGVVLSESFAPFTNAEGKTTTTTATDANGLPWKGGAVTITALPVLYSGRTITGGGTLTINLPGATNPAQVISPTAAGPVTATYSATAGSGSRVTGLTLVSAQYVANGFACGPIAACEANGVTPLGVTPTVIALDNAGNDLGLGVLNFTQPSLNLPNPTFRLDNQAPQPPTFFGTPGRQAGWVNAAYVFQGTGANGGFSAATGSAKYVSCGDGSAATNTTSGTGAYACSSAANGGVGQIGVSVASVSGNSGVNGQTTFSQYALSSGAYAAINGNGTSTSSTSCATTGWTPINTGGDLAEADATGNPFFIVRIFETDKLGNARCTDLPINANVSPNVNTGAFAAGRFSVDKTPPTVAYIETATDPTAAGNDSALGRGGNIANFNIKLAGTDNASGFSGTPITTMVTRLAMNPATGAASNAAGNFNNAFACPVSFDAVNVVCTTASLGFSNPATTGVVTPDGTTIVPGCNGCGYYTWSQTPLDLARNAATTVTGTATPTITGAFTAGAPGFRTVVVDQVSPVAGGIAVPASIVGGTSVSFATNAADNLDLISSDFTLTYAANPSGNALANLPIRAAGPSLGTAFDNVLTTSSSFNIAVPFFIRSIATTTAANAPQNNGGAGLPTSIAMRAYDAASNPSAVIPATNTGFSNIGAANVPQTGRTDFTVAPPGANVAAVMQTFAETNAAKNISNCPAAGCAGGVSPANPTTVTLTAAATGAEGANFQFLNPFSQVQFYYLDAAPPGGTGEYIFIGSSVAPVVSDNATVTVRTFTWTLATAFDPPTNLVAPVALNVVAVGVNAQGDALATAVNVAIALTNP